jgi:hypothetical protein
MPTLAFAASLAHHRLQIRIEHRRREPLVFAELRLHLGRQRDHQVALGLAQRIANPALVLLVKE